MNTIRTYKNAFIFLLSLVFLYGLFYVIDDKNLYLKDGSGAVNKTKRQVLSNQAAKDKTDKPLLFFIGDSRIMSGFVPEVFDSLSGEMVKSYNFAMGGEQMYSVFEYLKRMEVKPDILLIQQTWPEASAQKMDLMPIGDLSMKDLLPFKSLVRDMMIFAGRGMKQGYSLPEYYRLTQGYCETMLSNRGYFFIASEALFPNHQLPEDYQLSADDATKITHLELDPSGKYFKKIRQYALENDIKIIVAPECRRKGERKNADPSAIRNRESLSGDPHIYVTPGPPYHLLDNKYFSDARHLNPEGARKWTQMLYRDLSPLLQEIQGNPIVYGNNDKNNTAQLPKKNL